MRVTLACPGVRICCPKCGGVVAFAEMQDGEGFFRCQKGVPGESGWDKCGQHFYVACTAYLCTAIAVTKEEREAMRWIAGREAKLEWLGLRVAQETEPTRVAA